MSPIYSQLIKLEETFIYSLTSFSLTFYLPDLYSPRLTPQSEALFFPYLLVRLAFLIYLLAPDCCFDIKHRACIICSFYPLFRVSLEWPTCLIYPLLSGFCFSLSFRLSFRFYLCIFFALNNKWKKCRAENNRNCSQLFVFLALSP